MTDKRVDILRSDNRLVLSPTTEEVLRLLAPQLSYVEEKYYRGAEAAARRRQGLSQYDEIHWQCYDLDFGKRLGTSAGFLDRIKSTLAAAGYRVRVYYADKAEGEAALARAVAAYVPNWERVNAHESNGFKFLHRQREALEVMTAHECGRLDCPPAWGKGSILVLACMLFSRAKIAVVTKRVAVIRQRLYPELAGNLPGVGMVCDGVRRKGRRVTCYSADSLHHADGDEDLVLVDEGHEACADKFAASLARFAHARMWMFSASWDMRLDNKDLRAEALAGPIRFTVSYQEAVDHGIVVPIEIRWADVIMDANPCAGLNDAVERNRHGIWRNDYRNAVIARDARLYGADVQGLITVATLEHALHLKRLLPEFELAYVGRTQKPADLRYFNNQGLLEPGFRLMDDEQLLDLTDRFSAGKARKVIATTVWNVGVNFRHLGVLFRADAGGSPVNDTQIPGRNARHAAVGVKAVGVVHDYLDQFDHGKHQQAKGRQKNYEQHGWKQVMPDPKQRSKLRQLMGWSDK